MDVHMNNCRDCARIIASDATHNLCDICYAQYDRDIGLIEDAIQLRNHVTPEDIAANTHLRLERVQDLMNRAGMLDDGESEDLCSQCREKVALKKSKYCLNCQLAMYKSLGDGAKQASLNHAKPFTPPDTGLRSLRDTMDEKRQRTGGNRFRKNPPSVKGR